MTLRAPSTELSSLYAQAQTARGGAYVPYSGVAVGAAARVADGRVYGGANVANACGALAMCAERVAMYRAIFDGSRAITALAVAVDPRQLPSSVPCGACLQVLAEFTPYGDACVVFCRDQEVVVATLSDLLPYRFARRSK